jgi:hypothetical protein
VALNGGVESGADPQIGPKSAPPELDSSTTGPLQPHYRPRYSTGHTGHNPNLVFGDSEWKLARLMALVHLTAAMPAVIIADLLGTRTKTAVTRPGPRLGCAPTI